MYRKRRFANMYDTYADDIFRYLLVRVRDQQIAEDLTAETFTKAWKSIQNFNFSKPRPWLYTIASNLLTDYWRKKKTETLEDTEVLQSEENVEEKVEKKLLNDKLYEVIEKLPNPMHDVITLRFLLNYSVRKTADSLRITESNVRVLQYRALKKLRKLL